MRVILHIRTGPLSLLTCHAPTSDVADPQLECTPYYYPPADQWGDQFPTTWQPATILENDNDAQAMWANISKSVPTNIQPKGQLTGSTIGVNYDPVADPDCCELFFQLRRPIRG